MAVISTYTYNIEISYVQSDPEEEYEIQAQSIDYLVITNDYMNALTPTICFKIKLDSALYDRMQKDQDKGKVILNIQSKRPSATSSIYKSYICDQFDYIMTDSPNTTSDLEQQAPAGTTFHTCIIGLIKKENLSKNQKQFNGIYNNTTMAALVDDATKDMKILMEPLKNNTAINGFTVPPIDSVMKFLAYLNSKYNFYNDQYMFYIGLERTYMISNSGKYLDPKDNQYPYVAIDIRKLTDSNLNLAGLVVDDEQDAYIIYIDEQDASFHLDRVTPETAANIASVAKDGKNEQVTIDTSALVNTQPQLNAVTYLQSDDPNSAQYVANVLENNAVTIVVNKTEIDTSILTPNKEYLISNYEGNNQYTGRYNLAWKRELFLHTGANFTCAVNMGLKLVLHYSFGQEQAAAAVSAASSAIQNMAGTMNGQ